MYELIEHRRLDANAANITFSSIPQNYSDLVILSSLRGDSGSGLGNVGVYLTINGLSTNRAAKWLYGSGAGSKGSISISGASIGAVLPVASSTSNTFSNLYIYLPNYSGNTNKSFSVDNVAPQNSTDIYELDLSSNLWSSTAPITSLAISVSNGNLVQGSSATLYGINRTSGIGRAPLAMGGYMSYSNGYWVHTFPSSGSFIPFTNMEVEYLVIAGGGGGGGSGTDGSGGVGGGGGGAGGYRSSVIGELSGRNSTAESRLSLTANTNYTVTIGAGGAAGTNGATPGKGSNSVFSTITATGGGAAWARFPLFSTPTDSGNGGSGGGGSSDVNNAVGGLGTSAQGFDGGNSGDSSTQGYRTGAGGGGAGGAGISTNNSTNNYNGGAGGSGLSSNITGTSIARAGGGGGGGGNTAGTGAGGAGGLGGGGRGGDRNGGANISAGTANTGGGGGGAGAGTSGSTTGTAGGSGIVIVRYKA
jgi:hypothetical protein